MADLLVHVASSFAVGRPLRDGRLRAILYLGVCLPDVLYKTLLYLGNAPSWLCEPTHSPLGLLPFCYVGALLFEEAWRKRAFAALLAGGWLHLLVDLDAPRRARLVQHRGHGPLHAARARGDGDGGTALQAPAD
jgi:hypothetical protein